MASISASMVLLSEVRSSVSTRASFRRTIADAHAEIAALLPPLPLRPSLVDQIVTELRQVNAGFSGNPAHRLLPASLRKRQRRRLHRTLNQQSAATATLGRAGDFLPFPKQIVFFVADKTLAGSFRSSSTGKICPQV